MGEDGRERVSYSASRKKFLYGAGNADCSGHGAGVPDSGVFFVADEGGGEEMRTLSAKVDSRVFADTGFSAVGAVVWTGVAKGLLSAGVGPEADEKGFGFEDTLLVRFVAPNRLAPRSCLGCSGATGWVSSGFVSSCLFCPPTVTLRAARNALILPGLRLQGFLGQPNRYSRRSSVGK